MKELKIRVAFSEHLFVGPAPGPHRFKVTAAFDRLTRESKIKFSMLKKKKKLTAQAEAGTEIHLLHS